MHPEILNWVCVCVCVNINRKSYGKLHFGGLGLGLDPGKEILEPESLAPKKKKNLGISKNNQDCNTNFFENHCFS